MNTTWRAAFHRRRGTRRAAHSAPWSDGVVRARRAGALLLPLGCNPFGVISGTPTGCHPPAPGTARGHGHERTQNHALPCVVLLLCFPDDVEAPAEDRMPQASPRLRPSRRRRGAAAKKPKDAKGDLMTRAPCRVLRKPEGKTGSTGCCGLLYDVSGREGFPAAIPRRVPHPVNPGDPVLRLCLVHHAASDQWDASSGLLAGH